MFEVPLYHLIKVVIINCRQGKYYLEALLKNDAKFIIGLTSLYHAF